MWPSVVSVTKNPNGNVATESPKIPTGLRDVTVGPNLIGRPSQSTDDHRLNQLIKLMGGRNCKNAETGHMVSGWGEGGREAHVKDIDEGVMMGSRWHMATWQHYRHVVGELHAAGAALTSSSWNLWFDSRQLLIKEINQWRHQRAAKFQLKSTLTSRCVVYGRRSAPNCVWPFSGTSRNQLLITEVE